MPPEQKDIVRETWEQVGTIAEIAASLSYDRLFEVDPTIRPLLHRSIWLRREKN